MEQLATVAGLFIFGFIEALTGSMQNSLLGIILFFLLGFMFLILLLRNKKIF
jgi:UMF1 family MFS transporter